MQETKYTYKLARYLLRSSMGAKDLHDYAHYSDHELLSELADLAKKLKGYHDPGLTSFKHYRHTETNSVNLRHFREELLEENHVYDRFTEIILKEFCYIAIAFLVQMEKLHKKGIFTANVKPDNFLYTKKRKRCMVIDASNNIAADKPINIEKQKHGDLMQVVTYLHLLTDDKYLAPELKASMSVYNIERLLKNIIYVAEDRGLKIEDHDKIKVLLGDFHQKRVKYTNKAEIYSIGYTLNEILSHSLEKIAKLNLLINDFPTGPVDEEIVVEAELLLPDKFSNEANERIVDLLNEAVQCVHDLMCEQVEKRDSIAESIAKFKDILKRIKMVSPGGHILEKEEGEIERYEAKELQEAYEAEEEEHEHIEHEEHEEHLEHEEHGHATHIDHFVHGHGDHDLIHEDHLHDHGKHDHGEHADHEHAEHKHEAHEHSEHEHEEHEHEEHEHEEHEHEHEEHEHEEHEHEEHEHEEHQHEHEEHAHEEHVHEAHEHAEHVHEAHEEHAEHVHEAHEEHEEHVHEEHVHEAHVEHVEHELHEKHEEEHVSSLKPGSHH